jgi:hypothetical protein
MLPFGPSSFRLNETVKDVGQDGKRSVIVVLTVGSAASSSLRSDVVRADLRKSGTMLYVIASPGAGPARRIWTWC